MAASTTKMFVDATGDLLGLGYAVRFKASGHSMHPTIKDGEFIRVEPASWLEIKRGDIVLYRSRDGVIAHRVIRVCPRGSALQFILRGDAATSFDQPVASDQVLGRVTSVERHDRIIEVASQKARLLRAARAYGSRLKSQLGERWNVEW